MLAGKRVIIAGGGIGGLATAIAILNGARTHKLSPLPTVTVVERDASSTSRPDQGYSLSIRGDGNGGGYQALFDLGVLQRLLKDAEPGGAMTMREHDFSELARFGQISTESNSGVTGGVGGDDKSSAAPKRDSGHGMRIARPALRAGLLEGALQAGATVQWNKTVARIDSLPNATASSTAAATTGSDDKASAGIVDSGVVKVEFTDGSTAECDFLIVADGSRSRVRAQLLPNEVLRYAGAFTLATAIDVPPKAVAADGKTESGGLPFPLTGGSNSVFGLNGINSFLAPTHHGTQGLVAMTTLSAEPVPELKGHAASAEEVDAGLKQLHDMWCDGGFPQSGPMYALVQRAGLYRDRLQRFNAWDKLPHRYAQYSEEHPRVVFVGDACHPMSPFAGNGANMALMDGVTIGRLLCEAPAPPTTATAATDSQVATPVLAGVMTAYEAEMVPRSTKAIAFSHMMIGWHVKSWHQRVWRSLTARAFGVVLNHPRKLAVGLLTAAVVAVGYVFREPLGRVWTSQFGAK